VSDHDELPLPDYDHLPQGSLMHRIRALTEDELQRTRDYEQAHADQSSEAEPRQPLRHGVAGQTPNRTRQ
jgi:hypothetical protein